MKILRSFSFVFLGTFFIAFLSFYFFSKKEDKASLTTQIIKVDSGYGYQIKKNGKPLIRQEFIPAVPGQRSFATSENAKHIAELVKQKLLRGQSPVISIDELKELNINTGH